MQINILYLLILLGAGNVFGMADHVSPREGAVPVGEDRFGNKLYKAIDLVATPTTDLTPMVSGGTKSLDGEFPAMGMLSNCSSTLVGPRAIFTASHCQRTGTRITFKHRGSGKAFSGVCTRHPQYNDDTVFNDYTICELDEAVPEGSLMASFNISGAPDRNVDLMLNGGGLPNFGVHFWGKGVTRSQQGQDIVTCGPTNLTSGDSGGSLIRYTTDRKNANLFLIEGVNSRGGGGCSYFNNTSSPEFISWAKSFAEQKKLEICGINKDCSLGSGSDFCLEEKRTVGFLQNLLEQAKVRLGMCQKVIN